MSSASVRGAGCSLGQFLHRRLLGRDTLDLAAQRQVACAERRQRALDIGAKIAAMAENPPAGRRKTRQDRQPFAIVELGMRQDHRRHRGDVGREKGDQRGRNAAAGEGARGLASNRDGHLGTQRLEAHERLAAQSRIGTGPALGQQIDQLAPLGHAVGRPIGRPREHRGEHIIEPHPLLHSTGL